MAAEWWHIACVRDFLLGRPPEKWRFTKEQLLDWLGYQKVRAGIEERRRNRKGPD